MKATLALIALLSLAGCRDGGDNPGGYDDKYWQSRREMSGLAHEPRKPGSRDNFAGLALLVIGCAGMTAARYRRMTR